MNKHKLDADALKVEAFETTAELTWSTDTVVDADGCVCFAPPCICTAGADCTQG